VSRPVLLLSVLDDLDLAGNTVVVLIARGKRAQPGGRTDRHPQRHRRDERRAGHPGEHPAPPGRAGGPAARQPLPDRLLGSVGV